MFYKSIEKINIDMLIYIYKFEIEKLYYKLEVKLYMEKVKESQELWFLAKKSNPELNEEEFVEYAKFDIMNLHELLRNDGKEISKINCLGNVVNELLKNKTKYRLNPNIDHLSIHYAQIMDYIEQDRKYIKMYMSLFFYDNVKNNENYTGIKNDKFWNDIWIVTFKKKNALDGHEDFSCNKCGANMNFIPKENLLKCDYCGYTKYFNFNRNWVISKIEVK